MTERDSITMVEHIRATERERCIKIAEEIGVLEAPPADEFERGFHEAATHIAAAIRALEGKQPR